jgi:hypothetical protein
LELKSLKFSIILYLIFLSTACWKTEESHKRRSSVDAYLRGLVYRSKRSNGTNDGRKSALGNRKLSVPAIGGNNLLFRKESRARPDDSWDYRSRCLWLRIYDLNVTGYESSAVMKIVFGKFTAQILSGCAP